MSSKYKFRNQEALFFVTNTVVYWLDVFIRNEYRNILLESISWCQRNKGLEVYSWCIMTSHLQMIIGSTEKKLEDIMQSFKTNTSRHLHNAIRNNNEESRREYLIWMFERAGKLNSHNGNFQFWKEGNHPIELTTNEMIDQKLNYIHNNPVEAGFVKNPEDWTWSSAIDYAGGKGLLDILYIE